MPRFFHNSIHFEYHLFPKKLRALFVGHLLRGAAIRFVGLFIPLFLFTEVQKGVLYDLFPFFEQWTKSAQLSSVQVGMIGVALFYITSKIAQLVFFFPTIRLMRHVGLSRSMVLGNIFLLFGYASLQHSVTYPWLFFLAAVFTGIEITLYWTAYYTEFSVHVEMSRVGEEVGSLAFLEKLARGLLPFVAGFCIVVLGYSSLFAVGFALLSISTFFLLLQHDIQFSYTICPKDCVAWFKNISNRPLVQGIAGKTIEDGALMVWPVFLLLFVGNEQNVGFFASFVVLVSVIVSYFMGWYLGKHKGNRLFVFSGWVIGILWILRATFESIWNYLFIDLMDSFANSIHVPIFDTALIESARRLSAYHFFIFRELLVICTLLIFWIILLLFFISPLQWTGVYIFAAIGSFLSLRVRRPYE